jgi:L-amino acid N-acyltransferase YncA
MLQLFQSIFGPGRRDSSPHPAELITRAIERAVDGTDPRMRALSGYERKLRDGVVHAIDHVVALVDGLLPALDLNPRSYGTDAEITLYFASVEHLREVLERDPTLNDWRSSADGASAGHVVTLLLMTLQERKVLGVALEGDVLRRGVAQSTVSLSRHQLVDPTAAEDETRRRLKRRAFDHLLALALGRMASAVAERNELQRERDLLRRKCGALKAGHWGFNDTDGDRPLDTQALQQQLTQIESQLGALGSSAGLLQQNLDVLVDVLMQAEHNLWSAPRSLSVDRMGVKQTQPSALAPEVGLTVLHNAAGQSLVARLVGIDREVLPARRDLLREAERYLG